MILVIVVTDYNSKTGRRESLVSHGVDLDIGKTVILPMEPPAALGAVFDPDYGEYVLRDPPRAEPRRRATR